MPESSNLPHPPQPRRGSGQPRPRRAEESRPKLHGGNRRSTASSSNAEAARSSTERGSRQPTQSHKRKKRWGQADAQSRRQRNPRREVAPVFRPFTPEQLAGRAAAIPVVTFPDLPVCEHKDEIVQAIRDNQVVIVSGETGSGKTTQLPKMLIQMGRGVEGMIGHTQPRRIAAHAVAQRIAEELGQSVGRQPGQVVGYQVRFTDQVGPTTLVKLMTDGILLAEIQSDPLLRRYDTLIIDEAHERSLNIDFILGYLARLLPMRPDLKVIITSATIDSARFAEHFGRWVNSQGQRVAPGQGTLDSPAPVIEVSGRTFPVEIRYRPLSADLPTSWSSSASPTEETPTDLPGKSAHFQQLVLEDPDDDLPTLGYGLGEDIDQETAICAAVDELCAEGPGDILVFLPGERDIRDVQQALVDHLGPRAVTDSTRTRKVTVPNSIEIVPLYARLTAAEQQRIFHPHSLRRVVLSTNVAETSLTVPGIRYVIDPGLARISRYSNRTKVQRLPIEAISQASANQRAGRSGRLEDGVTIRLYSQRDYEARPAFTEPEILRTSLASVILQMAALGLGTVQTFPFLDAPDPRAVKDGVQLLVEIGALEYEEKRSSSGAASSSAGRKGSSLATRLTSIGRDLARLPIDPRLGRILLEADAQGAASEVLIIVAALSLQDVRERPLEHQNSADAAHARFTDPHSDFITYLNLWRYLTVQQRDLSASAFRRMCRAEFLHYLRWREWRDIVHQLTQLAQPLDLAIHPIGEPSAQDVLYAAQTGGIDNAAARAVVAYTASHRAVNADQIHRSLLVGLLSNLGSWDETKRDYQGARGTHFTIWPGSGLARSHPAWVMTAELVETSRLFARTVARIEPEWIEPVAKALVKRVYSEPYWSASNGAAMVKEKVLLYGLTLTADRSVLLGRIDHVFSSASSRASSVARPGTLLGLAQGLRAAEPTFDLRITGIDRLAQAGLLEASTRAAEHASPSEETRNEQAIFAGESSLDSPVEDVFSEADEGAVTAQELARELFIRHALVRGEWREQHAFQKENDALLDQAREVERRSRTHGLVADEDALFAFFDALIPEGVISARHFNQWWKGERRDRPNLLTFPVEVLLPRDSGMSSDSFPSRWHFEAGVGQPTTDGAPAASGEAMDLELSYQFTPGSDRDGVTVAIPVELLERFSDRGCDWLVPGLRSELFTEFIRALPKAKRRLLAPAPEVGAQIERWLNEGANVTASQKATASDTAQDQAEPDPMSLEAAMSRLAQWGQRTGKAKPSASSSGSGSPVSSSPQPTQPASEEDTVPQVEGRHPYRDPLWRVIADGARELRGVDLSESECHQALEKLPDHLRMTFVVVDRHGRELGSSKSLPHLQRSLASAADSAVRDAVRGAIAEALHTARKDRSKGRDPIREHAIPTDETPFSVGDAGSRVSASSESTHDLHADGLMEFPQTAIPRHVSSVGAGGMPLRGYPCLVPQRQAGVLNVGIRVMANPAQADRQHTAGVATLVEAKVSLSTARITTRWTGRQAAMLAASPYASTADLVADAQAASAFALTEELSASSDASSVRDSSSFDDLVRRVRQKHEDRVYEILGHVIRALEAHSQASEAMAQCSSIPSLKAALRDTRRQLKNLIYPGFIAQTPAWALPHLARYIKAIAYRLDKAMHGGIHRDTSHMDVISGVESALIDAQEAAQGLPFDATRECRFLQARWMIEELRVSLFAQTLGTPQKVSAQRIRNLLTA